MSLNPNSIYSSPPYILHVYINSTVWLDTSDITNPDFSSETIAYCKVLDILKGNTFPSLDNAIFCDSDCPKNSNITSPNFVILEKKDNTSEKKHHKNNSILNNTYSIPEKTDIVFSYRDNWQRSNGSLLLDDNGEHWIKPHKEYIVFLGFLGMDAIGCWDPENAPHKVYYSLSPYPHSGSFSMYPIENGNVIDETNALGFGKILPVDVFKQNIRNKIIEIKKFGE